MAMSSLIIENFLFSAESLIKGELWRLFKATLFNDSTFNGDIAIANDGLSTAAHPTILGVAFKTENPFHGRTQPV